MNRDWNGLYELELNRVAEELGLGRTDNVEDMIIEHCLARLRAWVAAHGIPETLSELANGFAASLDLRITEVRTEADIDAVLEEVAPVQKAVIGELKTEFGGDTDAIIVRRLDPKPWDRAYWAIINCQEWHEYRRYFTTWHEIVHLLLEGQQLAFAFRRTREKRSEPAEVLVDRVAAALAFYPDMFEPIVREEYTREGRLTFDVIDRVRERIAPDASREATTSACLRHIPSPVWFLQCGMGLSASEIRRLNSPQMSFFPEEAPEAKLRVLQGSSSPFAKDLTIRFHPNMRVPESSIVNLGYHDVRREAKQGTEALEAWETSSGGPIGSGEIYLEARRSGDAEVWAIASLKVDG
ncbi:MAG: hypothetical protein OXO50_09460 [Caldilineaceae bacterium]|nr:hypothetical protein [Caldilineaceae bacterium]